MPDPNPKTILLVHCYPPARGGSEFLAGHIHSILNCRMTNTVITGYGYTLDSYKTFDNWVPSSPDETNDRVYRLQLRFGIQRWANRLLNKIIHRLPLFSPYYFGPFLKFTSNTLKILEDSDIIIGQAMPTLTFVESYRFAKTYNKPLILFPAYHNVAYYNNCPLFQQCLDYAEAVVYHTAKERSELLSAYRVDERKMHQLVISPFSEEQLDKNRLADPRFRKTLNSKNNPGEGQYPGKSVRVNPESARDENASHVRIGCIGQVTPRKNLRFFREYLDRFSGYWTQKGKHLTIIIAGARTNSSSEVEAMFREEIDSGVVKFIYNYKDPREVMDEFDCAVQPSYEESLGIVNFETMFYGKPTLVHKDSAFAEFIPSMTFSSPETLHTKITGILGTTGINSILSAQEDILRTYSYDCFAEGLTQIVKDSIASFCKR